MNKNNYILVPIEKHETNEILACIGLAYLEKNTDILKIATKINKENIEILSLIHEKDHN